MLPPAKLVPAGFSVGGTRHLPCSSCHHQGVLTMVAQHLSLLCQGWVASDSYQTPCPRSCFRRRTSTAAVLPSICRSITLPACNHASTVREFRRWCVTAPSMLHRRWTAIDAHRTLLVPRLRAWSLTSSSSARPCSNTISRGSYFIPHETRSRLL